MPCMVLTARSSYTNADARQAFKGIRSLITTTLFNATDSKGRNPLWPAIMYEGARLTMFPPLLPLFYHADVTSLAADLTPREAEATSIS